eukprot:Pompholyxophrys_sp_v1_NODE_501_length_511_cov_2.932018.p1 type:complete len:108 gc:universal NODE_501_length_511_cov_2.932018:155-478(+)
MADDIRLTALLTQPGSTPLDLFRDAIEELDEHFHRERKIVKEILRTIELQFSTDTSYELFVSHLSADPRYSALTSPNIKIVYEQLMEKEEELKKAEERRKKKKEEAA